MRAIFEGPGTTLMPFGALPVHAQMAERAGFEAFEISGAMVSWWIAGRPDVGYLTMTEFVEHAGRVASCVDIPIFCDADTGFGGPINVRRTTQEFIRAGVAGIHIEDQENPKKTGGRAGIRLVSDGEAVGRLRAAIDARDELDPDFVIVARTDAYGAEGGGLEEAIRRGVLYTEEAGVDVIFYEGMRSWEEVRTALEETPGPAYAIPSRVAGPHPSMAELSEMGQAINIVPFVLPGIQEIWDLLLAVKESKDLTPIDAYVKGSEERRGTDRYVGWGDVFVRPDLQTVRELEEKYLPEHLRRDYANTSDLWEEPND